MEETYEQGSQELKLQQFHGHLPLPLNVSAFFWSQPKLDVTLGSFPQWPCEAGQGTYPVCALLLPF